MGWSGYSVSRERTAHVHLVSKTISQERTMRAHLNRGDE